MNNQLKRIVLISCTIILLASCTSSKPLQKSSISTDKTSDIAMGQKLALIDGKKEPAQIEIYSNKLNKLKQLCIEDEETLGTMVFAITKMGKEAGYQWSTNLDTLQSFVDMADSGLERKPGRCQEVYSSLRQSYKDESTTKNAR